MIKLDGGIVLPLPKKAKGFTKPDDVPRRRWDKEKEERWTRAYQHCLYALHNHFDLPLHSVVPRIAGKMLEASDPLHVALRFMGEMERQGYVKFDRGMDKRTVLPTKKLSSIDLCALGAPESAIRLPLTSERDVLRGAVPIRGGVANRENKRIASICKDMAKQKFRVNEFVFHLLVKFPPEALEPGAKYMYARTMDIAESFIGKEFMFPQFLDSRSRMYDDTTCGMSPQGADHEKSLCLPTYEEVLTDEGFNALVETAHGYSEIEWSVEDMASMARNPKGWEEVWKEADKPYSYMSCADLIRRYCDDPTKPLPAFIPLDGRCSGLQHWSAVIRSNAITRHLGMHKEEDSQDIYEKVASDWAESLEPEWRFMATRKTAKIPVMTWGYSATVMTSVEHMDKLFGAKQKWDSDLGEFVLVGDGLPRSVTAKKGGEIYKRLNETLGPLQAGVKWVCDSAGKISGKGNVEIRWPTPDGFTALQRKVKGEKRDLACRLSNGLMLELDILDFTKNIPNTAKHRSAIAPNIIHSLDATHLRMVAIRLAELLLPMIFIHDSFATHVNHRAVLYEIIIDTFIELYSGNYLAYLKTYWEAEYDVELGQMPPLGDWEPQSLRGLQRFFM